MKTNYYYNTIRAGFIVVGVCNFATFLLMVYYSVSDVKPWPPAIIHAGLWCLISAVILIVIGIFAIGDNEKKIIEAEEAALQEDENKNN